MIQSIRTMDASFTPSKKVRTESLCFGSRTLMAAPKRIVKTIRGSRSISAAAWTGFRGIMLSSVSTREGACSASSTLSAAWPSNWAERASRVEASTLPPGSTRFDTASPMLTAMAVVHM